MSHYDEVDIADMEWSQDLQAYTYQCPCGDLFQITLVSPTPAAALSAPPAAFDAFASVSPCGRGSLR